MGILYLFGSTATIDTGIMNMDLHVMCAGHFFILTIISCLYNTVVFVGVYRATKLITKASVVIKVTLSVLLIYQVYLSATKTAGIYAFGTDNSDLSHILEYTLAFSCLGYVLSYAYDLKDFKLAYRSVAKWLSFIVLFYILWIIPLYNTPPITHSDLPETNPHPKLSDWKGSS